MTFTPFARFPSVATLAALATLAASAAGCASRPPPRPIAMESLGVPGDDPVRTLRLHVGEAVVLVDQAVLVEANDPALIRIYLQDETLAIVGKSVGVTTLRLIGREGDSSMVRVEIAAGDPSPRALAIGDTLVVPMKGVHEYSVGLPGVIAVTLTSNGSQLVVTGRKAGTTTLVTFDERGLSHARELLVVGGQRLEIAASERIVINR